jgi:Reverse transcriptase (RNA-dependent DNA polymerase)
VPDLHTPPSLTGEIAVALGRVPLRKAAGPDGVYGVMVRLASPWLRSMLPSLWQTCGSIASVPGAWTTVLLEPVYKHGPRLEPSSYRPIGLLSVLRRVIDSALDGLMRRSYRPHPAQYGFRRGIGTDHALLRIHRVYSQGPTMTALLDLRQAYDSVPRRALIALLEARFGTTVASMAGILSSPTTIMTAGDTSGTSGIIGRGVTQGDPKAPTMFNVFLDSLLSLLDPHGTGDQVVAFADDISLLASSVLELQRLINVCAGWAADCGMTWSPSKSVVIAEGRPNLTLNGTPIPSSPQGRCLGVSLSTAGLTADGSVQRVKMATQRALRWYSLIRLNRYRPNYPWRRAMLVKFIRPLAEHGIHLVTMSWSLRQAMVAFELAATSFLLGHRCPGRVPLTTTAALFRAPTLGTRRIQLAHGLLLRLHLSSTHAHSNRYEQPDLYQEAQARVRDAQAASSLGESFNPDWLAPATLRAWWIRSLNQANLRRVRQIPMPTSISRTAARTLPPALHNRGRRLTPFLIMQFYLGNFPRGLTAARWCLGTQLAQTTFAALSTLLSKSTLSTSELCTIDQITSILLQCEPGLLSGTTSR